MSPTPLEDQVHDALHRTADPLQRTPFTVGDVRTRARRLQRRRTATAGAAVAAVLAIALPVGLSLTDPTQRSEVPPATQSPTPQVTDTVRIDPRSVEVVDSTSVPLLDVDGPSLIMPERTIELPKVYDTITPYRDGWLAVANVEGGFTAEILDADLALVDEVGPTGGVVVSQDGERVAWSEYDGTRWQVTWADVAGGEERTSMSFPPGPATERVEPVGFVAETEVVARQVHSDGTTSTFIADRGTPLALPGPVTARSASQVGGVVAAVTSSDVEGSCSAVIDGRAPSGDAVWETCDHSLTAFSPDGRHLVGLAAYGDANGSPTLAVLDATTGERVVDFEVVIPRQQVGGFDTRMAWEDDDTLVVRVFSGEDYFIVRLGLDGSAQRVGIDSAGASGLSVAEVH